MILKGEKSGSYLVALSVGFTDASAGLILPAFHISDAELESEKIIGDLVSGKPNSVGDRTCHHWKFSGSIEAKSESTSFTEGPFDSKNLLYSGIYPKKGSMIVTGPFGMADLRFGYRFKTRTGYTDEHIWMTCRALGNNRYEYRRYTLSASYGKNGSLETTRAYAWVGRYRPRTFMQSGSRRWEWTSQEMSTAKTALTDPSEATVISHDFGYIVPYADEVAAVLAAKDDGVDLQVYKYSYNWTTSTFRVRTPLCSASIDALAQKIKDSIFSPAPGTDDWSALGLEAIQNADYVDINSIAYIKDFRDLFSELKALKKVLGNPTSPKAWANLILSASYGTRLTIMDTVELINAIIRLAKQGYKPVNRAFKTLRSRKIESLSSHSRFILSGHRELHYKVYHKQFDRAVDGFIDSLRHWDLLPTAGNMWDLVPYSFVIDWFVNIGDNVEIFDAIAYANTLQIIGVTYSYKDTYQVAPIIDGYVISEGVLSIYHRMIKKTLDLPPYSLEFNQGYENNIIQGGALLVSKRSK